MRYASDTYGVMRSAIVGVVMAGAVACAGCLPEPTPAVGKHLVPARDVEYVTLSRGADGEAGDDVVYVKQKDPPTPIPESGGLVGYPADLFAVSTGGGATRRLAEDISPALGGLVWDARARLVVVRPTPSAFAPSQPHGLIGIDVATGAVDDLGGDNFWPPVSLSGHWIITIREAPDAHLWAVSVDGLEVDVGPADHTYYDFVGDRIFYREDAGEAGLIAEDGTKTVLADVTMSDYVRVFPMADGDLLVTLHAGPPASAEWRLLGTANAGSIVNSDVSNVYNMAMSRDRKKIAYVVMTPDGTFEAHALTPGATPPQDEAWELPPSSVGLNYLLTWRPGTDELWCLDNNTWPVVLRPGQPAVASARGAVIVHVVDPSSPGPTAVLDVYAPAEPGATYDFFIEGGRWWIARDAMQGGTVRLAEASDPSGATGIVLGEAGEFVKEVAILEPGRRIAVRMLRSDDLTPPDLYTIDLTDGTKRLVATHAPQVVYGTNRVLVSAEANQAGDGARLSLIDLLTGATSVIADNVAQMVVARPCRTCLPLDPGARTAFTIQARFPFEQDGVWTGTLP
jgi:hypothetical protein